MSKMMLQNISKLATKDGYMLSSKNEGEKGEGEGEGKARNYQNSFKYML